MWFINLEKLSVIFSEIFQAIYKQIAIKITELKFCEQLRTHFILILSHCICITNKL
jgi:hypothetical protein